MRMAQALLKKLGGRQGIEEVLGKWILDCRDDLNTQGNQFRKFLENCNELEFGEDKYIPCDALRRAFTDWCQKNMVKTDVVFTDDTIEDGFSYAERRLMGPNNTVRILPKHTRGQVWDVGYNSVMSFKGISLRNRQRPLQPHNQAEEQPDADFQMARNFLTTS